MTLASHTPATWTDILSTTVANRRKSIVDNVWNKRPFLQHLMSNGRVNDKVTGGHSLVEQLEYAEGDGDSYSEWQAIDVTPVNTVTAAQFPWRQTYATISISGLEEAQNSGNEAVVDLLDAKIRQAENTSRTQLNRMLLGTRGGAAAATDFDSVVDYVDVAATACGGIVNESWWASLVDDDAGNGTMTAAGLEEALRNAYNQTSDAGGDHVDAIFTNAYGFGFYESTLTPQVRYQDTGKANLGFQNLLFKDVPIMWDFDVSGGTEGTLANDSASFYGVNSQYMRVKCHKDRYFKMSPFSDNLAGNVSPTGGATGPGTGVSAATALDARVAFITTYGNLCISNRRRFFKITGVVES